MDWFKTVFTYYNGGYYTIDQVKVFVEKNKITAEEFKEMTGQDYTA